MNTLRFAAFTRNILVPGWIAMFGLVSFSAPPLGVVASLSLFLMGIVVIPALVLIPCVVYPRAPSPSR